jgi:hypothetical protein
MSILNPLKDITNPDSYPIYKSLYGLKMLKKQTKYTIGGRVRVLNSFLSQYTKAIDEAKAYKAKAPKESSTGSLFKSGSSAYITGNTYVSPKQYTNKDEWDKVIKELTECKKYLEQELKHTESYIEKNINEYSLLFDFEFK